GVLVEPVHGLVPVGYEHDFFVTLSGCPPCSNDPGLHLQAGPAVKSTLRLIRVDCSWVAMAESEAGLAFPFVMEPVDLFQFGRTVDVDKVSEHSASSDG